MISRNGLSRRIAALMIAAVAVAASPIAHADAKESGRIGAGSRPPYQIYLLKGLADVFSSGMDFLQAKLRARGIRAEVHSHTEWEDLTRSIIARWRSGAHGPVILIGHSFGADAVIKMSEKLGEAGVPVALLVAFSPVEDAPANANVARAVTYFQSNSAWHGQITKGPGFHGVLQNVDLANAPGITHFNIEKAADLHAATIAKVVALIPSHAPHSPHQDATVRTPPPSGAAATATSDH